MKKTLLIAGLLSCAAVSVSNAGVGAKQKQEPPVEITEQDIKEAQDAIVAVLTEAMAEAADDSDQEQEATTEEA